MTGAAEPNPYFDDSEDEDIIRASEEISSDQGRKHIFDGTTCWCSVEHHLHLPPDMPPEVLDKINDLIEKLPDKAVEFIVTKENSLSMKLVHDFIEFANELDRVNRSGPLQRAMAEATENPLAPGERLAPRIRVYEAELRLVITHRLMKVMNNLREQVYADRKADNMSQDNGDSVIEVINHIIDGGVERLELATSIYRALAEDAKMPIDERLIEVGMYSPEASFFATRLIEYPVTRSTKRDDDEDEVEESDEDTP